MQPCDDCRPPHVYGVMTPDHVLSVEAIVSPDTDEERLVRLARHGDRTAFASLYVRHARAVHALAWRLTSDRILAEDIVQDAFLRMLRHVGGLDPRRPVLPWLKQVTANLAIDRLRRRWRELPDDATLEHLAEDSVPDAYDEALGLLRRLCPQARTLVWLNQMEGWTHRELGRRFGRSESWSKSIVQRALTLLREHANEERRDAD